MSTTLEQCSNCDLGIGKLETPYVWNGSIVCQSCHQRLSQLASLAPEPTPTPPPIPPSSSIPYATPAHLNRSASYERFPGATGPVVICPNQQCGYNGRGIEKRGGSMLVFIILILFWILPGIIYYALCMKTTLSCPKCGIKIRDV